MLGLGDGLRRSLVDTYQAGTAALVAGLVRGRTGPRDFRRVVVVAALGRNNGIASGARLQYAALRQCGVEAELLDATRALRNPLFRIPHRAGSAYVFHSGGPQTASLIGAVMPQAAQAFRVGYWAWELPDPPLDWSGCERNLDEVWTPSSFSRTSLARCCSLPIAVVPHHVPARPPRQRRPGRPFTVLVIADSRSSLSRKNPAGALRAFRIAFGSSPDARLLLKFAGDDAQLRSLADGRGHVLDGGNIRLVREHLDDAALANLFREADALLSLHRAEGFGLPMIEAMAHGLPVVATGWSGNLEFMDDTDSCLVPYRIVPVSDASAVYAASRWAEPDVEAAARALRRLATEPAFYARLAAAAHARIAARSPQFPFATPCDPVRPETASP
jgi:glycosyltransferase involved in cell wall biosynthesis